MNLAQGIKAARCILLAIEEQPADREQTVRIAMQYSRGINLRSSESISKEMLEQVMDMTLHQISELPMLVP